MDILFVKFRFTNLKILIMSYSMNKWQKKINKLILLLILFSLKFNIISTYFVYFNNYVEFKKLNHVTSRPKG